MYIVFYSFIEYNKNVILIHKNSNKNVRGMCNGTPNTKNKLINWKNSPYRKPLILNGILSSLMF